MKWETHRRITRAVCSGFGLSSSAEIVEACILPDKQPDYTYRAGKRRVYRVRVSHHGDEAANLAFDYLKKARKAYLRADGRYKEYLGRALHYIQDCSVDPNEKLWIFSFRSDQAHNGREDAATSLRVPEEAIKAGFSETCTPSRVKDLIRYMKPRKSPEEIMVLATYLSAIAVKAVFAPDKTPGAEEKYRKALKIHLVLVLAPFLILLSGLTALNFVLAMILSGIVHMLDFYYHKWKLECEWFKP